VLKQLEKNCAIIADFHPLHKQLAEGQILHRELAFCAILLCHPFVYLPNHSQKDARVEMCSFGEDITVFLLSLSGRVRVTG